jgi:NitT/TauT family transport system substrate-binding protein
VKNVADQAVDPPYNDEYCCAVLVNGKFLAAHPKAAAAAARMSVEKKYLASNPELNTVAIANLRYAPSVSGAEAAVKSAAAEMKRAGMLNASTDVNDLARRAFAHFDDVTDNWLDSVQVETVAGGQVPPDEDRRLRAELAASKDQDWCGLACCVADSLPSSPFSGNSSR